MRRFLTYCLLFAIITTAILAAGEVLCRNYPNPYRYKDKWLTEHAGEVTTLILGSSVNYYGINPALMEGNTFNLANVSQNFEYDYLLLKHYFENSDSLRRILLSVGYATLTDPPLEQSHDWTFAQGYHIYMHIGRNPVLSRYSTEIANFNGYAGKFRNLITGRNSIICDTLGHGTAMSAASRSAKWKEEIHITVGRHTAADFSHVKYNLAYLDSILDWSHRHNVETILISTPKHRLYREAMPQRQKELTWHLTDSVVCSRGIRWIDMTDDPEFTDDDFYDGDHLSSDRGADHLTMRLHTLLPPL